jgi:hypothetical protein
VYFLQEKYWAGFCFLILPLPFHPEWQSAALKKGRRRRFDPVSGHHIFNNLQASSSNDYVPKRSNRAAESVNSHALDCRGNAGKFRQRGEVEILQKDIFCDA